MRLAAEPGSAHGEGWLNWVLRHRAADRAIGTVQATLKLHEEEAVAGLEWVISSEYQRQGHAKEPWGRWRHGFAARRWRGDGALGDRHRQSVFDWISHVQW
jgi:hypothetical protein